LIIGHGTVGSVLRARIRAAGGQVWVYDPDPRLELPADAQVFAVDVTERVTVDHVAVCVPASAGATVAGYLRDQVDGGPLVFDWASTSPAVKLANADPNGGTWIDVALLDSLDRAVDRPLLAISGSRSELAAAVLGSLGFEVAVAGAEVGQAAAVKLTRSLFMKALEALVVEFRSIASGLDRADAAWLSVRRSLGDTFADFADVLVTSDAVHAGRRAVELRQALAYGAEHGWYPGVADAAATTLERLAKHWSAAKDLDEDVAALLTNAQLVFAG
jgi:3-hydroxyisobutyrate dehydrogenase-like beta-hydroxyacid dehydrogenase